MNLKKIGKLLTSKSVGTGTSSYEKKNLRCRGLTKVEKHCSSSQVKNVRSYSSILLKVFITLRFFKHWDNMTSPVCFVGPPGKVFLSNYLCKNVATVAVEHKNG